MCTKRSFLTREKGLSSEITAQSRLLSEWPYFPTNKQCMPEVPSHWLYQQGPELSETIKTACAVRCKLWMSEHVQARVKMI